MELCKTKLAGSKFDKFWVESIMKRFNTTEKVAPIIEYLQTCDSAEKFNEFITDLMMSQEERVKMQLEKEKEETKELELDAGWTKDEIALMTKAIVKFPPGTKDRWMTISQFVGSKTQKECIKKA